MYEFKLPDLGEGIHEGELLKWHVAVGDTIREDEPLVDVETDKAAVTIPSPRGGKVAALNGGVGDTVTVGSVIAVIDDGSGGAAAAPAAKPAAAPAAKAAPAAPAAAKPAAPAAPPAPAPKPAPAAARPAAPPADDFVATGPVAAAPAVRREAREMGIDIRRVRGSGPAGRIVAEDLHRYAAALAAGAGAGVEPEAEPEPSYEEAAPAAPGTPVGIPFFELEPLPDFTAFGETEREPLRSIRRKVARRMVTSMVMVPHVALLDEADVSELDAFRRREQERRAGQPGGKLSLLSFVVKSIATGLVDFPMFNASIDPFREELVYKKYYSVGIATDTPKGLMVPVVKNADRKSISEIAAEIEQLALRARAGAIDVADLRGGTFSITNVGPLGGKGLIPTINYPECAILGMGRAEQRPVVRDGQVVVRTILPLTLTFDHRIADGADAARFMSAVIRRLSDPLGWLLEA